MKDMLVRLMELPDISEKEGQLAQEKIIFRKPIPPEKSFVRDWVFDHFGALEQCSCCWRQHH